MPKNMKRYQMYQLVHSLWAVPFFYVPSDDQVQQGAKHVLELSSWTASSCVVVFAVLVGI